MRLGAVSGGAYCSVPTIGTLRFCKVSAVTAAGLNFEGMEFFGSVEHDFSDMSTSPRQIPL